MGLFTPRDDRDEEPAGDPVALQLDLDEMACPICGRTLHPWQDTCPEDGAAAVPHSTLRRLAPPPTHLLDDED